MPKGAAAGGHQRGRVARLQAEKEAEKGPLRLSVPPCF